MGAVTKHDGNRMAYHYFALTLLVQSVKPSTSTTGTGVNQILPGVRSVEVAPVTNDANDWVYLPPLADTENGHEILT